jgi:hypothetical protein
MPILAPSYLSRRFRPLKAAEILGFRAQGSPVRRADIAAAPALRSASGAKRSAPASTPLKCPDTQSPNGVAGLGSQPLVMTSCW